MITSPAAHSTPSPIDCGFLPSPLRVAYSAGATRLLVVLLTGAIIAVCVAASRVQVVM